MAVLHFRPNTEPSVILFHSAHVIPFVLPERKADISEGLLMIGEHEMQRLHAGSGTLTWAPLRWHDGQRLQTRYSFADGGAEMLLTIAKAGEQPWHINIHARRTPGRKFIRVACPSCQKDQRTVLFISASTGNVMCACCGYDFKKHGEAVMHIQRSADGYGAAS